MFQAANVYIPIDRRHALAENQTLPERTDGAALFADISGFTPLTEALVRTFGSRRGADELSRQLNRVYDVLIAEIDNYRGSVIGFAGDAITCWFANDSASIGSIVAPLSATACALAMQRAMGQFAATPLPDGKTVALAMKAAIATGSARRWVVGDPTIQLFDTLAGATVIRVTAAEHFTNRGEVVVDSPTLAVVAERVQTGEQRFDEETGELFTVIKELITPVETVPWPVTAAMLPDTQIRPWLLPAVFERQQEGMGEFLTELRPVVALFLSFSGIDFEADPEAGTKLDAFIRRVQTVLADYEGTLLQPIIGDKGSYLYAAFGAPNAHENDPWRAARSALELLNIPAALPFLEPLKIGISQGTLRAGAYGGTTRRTYGVLGDDVNVAARLMQQAAPGQVIVAGHLQKALQNGFNLDVLPPIPLKGKAEPLPIVSVLGQKHRQAIHLVEPTYTLPMIGREQELATIEEKIDLVLGGRGQIVGISGDAGMGKSRLVSGAIGIAQRHGLRGFGGECQSYGMNVSYLVWEPIWREFFDLDAEAPLRQQTRTLEQRIEALAPKRLEALPLLSSVLNMTMPDNDFTRTLEPRYRKAAVEDLLVECLRAAARQAGQQSGLIFILEDVQWIDSVSHDLLELVARAVADLPVLVLLAYRPPEARRLQAPRVEAMPHFTPIRLSDLTTGNMEQLIRVKLAQLMPGNTAPVPDVLIERITARVQGNPFYVEEVLNYFHDRGVDPHDPVALTALEIPNSLHSLILSRIDKLTERQKITVRVASVIGRLFRFAWLHGYYPTLGDPERLRADLDELSSLDLTPLDQSELELSYLFKHIITQEVSYESLPYATRAALHEQLAVFLEALALDNQGHFLDLLAFHYDRSENLSKRREYLWRAGEAAAARFANVEAVDYLSRALKLAPESDLVDRYAILLAREKVYDLQGEREAQLADLEALEGLAETLADESKRAEIAVRRANYSQRTSDYPAAIAAAQRAVNLANATGLTKIEAAAYGEWGWGLVMQGDYAGAAHQLQQSLRLARAINDRRNECITINDLGTVSNYQGDFARSLAYHQEALVLARELGNPLQEAIVRSNIGSALYMQDEHAGARDYFEGSLAVFRAAGTRQHESIILNNLGTIADTMRDFNAALAYYQQSLGLSRAVGDRNNEALAIHNLGCTIKKQGDYVQANVYLEQGLNLAREIGNRRIECVSLSVLGLVALIQGDYQSAYTYFQQTLDLADLIGELDSKARALCGLGDSSLGLGRLDEATDFFKRSWAQRQEMGQANQAAEATVGLTRVARARGALSDALAYAEELLPNLGTKLLQGVEEPMLFYLTCFYVLQANHDPRADKILDQAYTELQTQATSIPDEPTRRSFLENVPYHREIIAAWTARSNGNQS